MIRGELEDGTEIDLLSGKKGGPNWEKPSLAARKALYKNMQWRSYFISLNRAIGTKLYPFYGQYLCSQWNGKSKDEKKLKSLTVYFMNERTVPPGEKQGVEKEVAWEQSCEQ